MTVMKKLLWLDINCSYAHSSLALPAMHAQCGDACAEWDAVSATLATPVGTLLEQVTGRNPDIIAATAWLFTHDYLLNVIARVKELLPDAVVILGGPEFLGDNETYLRRHSEIDFVFRGEGEEEFSKWLGMACGGDAATAGGRGKPDRVCGIKAPNSGDMALPVKKCRNWDSVAGLCWLDDDGEYHDGGLARVLDFAGLQPPEASRFFNWEKPFVQLETTRGCFNSCAFCVSGAEKPVRETPVSAVRERIKNIYEHGIREVRMLDRTFNGNAGRAVELIGLFMEFPDMRFHLEFHPSFLPGGLRELLKALPDNLLHLEAGIQSLREPVQKACRRVGELGDALDGLRFLCGLKNMETHADLIAGLPLYTLGQIFEDVRTLASYGAGEIQLELLKVLPGTAMRNDAAELGLVYSPLPPYEILKTNEMGVAEMQAARLLSRLLDLYYNSRAWRDITMRLIAGESGFLPGFLGWMRKSERLDQPLSVEKRGLLLIGFIAEHYPEYLAEVCDAWISAGLTPRKIERFVRS